MILLLLITTFSNLYGQLSVETSGIFSTESNTPFWFQSNRNGVYSSEGSQFLTRLQYHNSYDELNNFKILYGTSVIGRPGSQSTLSLNQGYLKIRGFGLEFAGGRFIDPSPLFYDNELGMGSLGVSTNASPIPKLKLGLRDWLSVPFTNDFLQVYGYVTHGWLGSARFGDNVLLHEKAGYFKLGGDRSVNVYGGLVHYVIWGGSTPEEGDIPNGFSDFIDIFFAQSGDESTPGSEQAYVLGNQLGTWSFGSLIDLSGTDISIYLQSPIETNYDLKLKNMSDILTGISFDFGENATLPVDKFVYEYLYTKNQSGPRRVNPDADPDVDRFRGNQNYYNHEIYESGWAYQYRTIGNPLFKADEDALGILNNRIIAHHVGIESSVNQVDLFGKITYSKNFGKRCDNRNPDIGEGDLFGIQCNREVTIDPGTPITQWSLLAGTEFPLPIIPDQNIRFRVETALDSGRLFGDQFGILTSIRWTP
ncbi:MAG: capsule assembly Wzi family protein [Balneolaceae bacterium]|nr:capsule assembly Wzi family protein [Balneolaceae bacterium]